MSNLPTRANNAGLTVATAVSPPSDPEWLVGWNAMVPVPVSRKEVERLLISFQRALKPASQDEILAALEPAILLFDQPAGWERQIDLYLSLLADLPADLLLAGVFEVMQTSKFFPKPSEIREAVKDELGRRRVTLAKLSVAHLRAKDPEPEREPLTDEQIAKLDELLARHGITPNGRQGRPVEPTRMTAADYRRVIEECAMRPKIPVPTGAGTTEEN